MNIETLKMFIMITQKGSISAAAAALGYAQSNLSTRVHTLEDELHAQLFYRNSRGVTLTQAGQDFYIRAVKVVGLADEMVNQLQHPKAVTGALKLGTLQTAAATFLPGLLAQYHQQYPDVALTIKTGTTLASAQRVLNYELDGAIIGGKVNERALKALPLADERICLVTASGQPVDIQKDALLVFPSGCAYRQTLTRWLDAQKIMVRHPIEFNDLSAIIASVSAGLGISILPEKIVQPYADAKVLTMVPLPPAFATLPVAFIYRRDYVPNRAFSHFIGELKSQNG